MNKLNIMDVKASGECCLTLQKYNSLSNNSYRVVCSHAPIKYSKQEYKNAVARLTDNKFKVVEGSLKVYNEGHFSTQPHVEMIIEANTISKAYNEDNAKGLKVVKANVFLSAEDQSIWKKVGEGAEARLVLTSSDNFEDILKSRKNHNITTASMMIEQVEAKVGDYVCFYNPAKQALQFGIMSSASTIFERSELVDYKVDSNQIVEAASVEDLNMNVKAAVDSSNLNKFLDYMRRLYGAHPEFFNRLEELVKMRASEGFAGNFNSTEDILGL